MDHGKAMGSVVKRKKEGEMRTGGPDPQKGSGRAKYGP